jgi:ribosomal protein S18 acetylase RimI-like enzyme
MTTFPIACLPPDPALTVRTVRLSDTDRLAADCWPRRGYSTVFNLVQNIHRAAKDGRGQGLVIPGQGGHLIGYGQVMLWPTVAEISDLAVTDSHQGRGYGTGLIQHLVRAAHRLGADTVEIGVAESNQRARALYQRLGFAESHSIRIKDVEGTGYVHYLRLSLAGLGVGAGAEPLP